jgi:isoaspartyl peptidase/L-asparaginase-like protein (Ntn-hydrolase superfamily)
MSRCAPVIVLHGGAGVPPRDGMPSGLEQAALAGLADALDRAHAVLRRDGSAVEAVTEAVIALENDPVFNAGHGGALTSAGHVEHDAAVMEGRSRRAGAVAGTRRIANPVALARLVMEDGRHVLLGGEGAEAFAALHGVPLCDPDAFITPRRREALARVQAGRGKHDLVLTEQDRHGTVGAVARDSRGDLAAATSTGGRTNKLPGRIGDSPLIGAGTYADNAAAAISCTGSGEHFIRAVVAHRLAALMEIGGQPLARAAEGAMAALAGLGGTGGLIAVDAAGRIVTPFNTKGMYRALIDADGRRSIAIW